MIGIVLIGGIFFLSILYYVVLGTVEEGILTTLMKYDKLKNQK